ncbi:MAG: DUF3795 domain-containing protein [Anaerolineae bacterium]
MAECDALVTPCGLYCGSCRFYMGGVCRGCGTADRAGCALFDCCRLKRGLRFCTECEEFPCEALRKSVGLDPRWLAQMAEIPIGDGGSDSS